MFAVEGDKLTLHLGLPDGPSDEEVASRYHEMVLAACTRFISMAAAGQANRSWKRCAAVTPACNHRPPWKESRAIE
jgi:hypothetical protein